MPIYHADSLVRRAESLQLTVAARAAHAAGLPAGLFDRLGLKNGERVRVTQGTRSVTMPAVRDAQLAENVVRGAGAPPAAAGRGRRRGVGGGGWGG